MKSLKELMNLDGRVALITGGAGHIGSAMGEALAELGANVVVLDSSASVCADAANKIQQQYGQQTMPLPIDLADENSVRSAPEKVLNQFGRLDILVNCAAMVNTSNLKGWVAPFSRTRCRSLAARLRSKPHSPVHSDTNICRCIKSFRTWLGH